MQAVDPNSAPIVGTNIDVTVSATSNMFFGNQSEHARADEKGFVVLDLSKSHIGTRPSISMSLDGPPALIGKVEIPNDLTVGINDLGAVVFKTSEPLATGRCVTQSGKPLGSVELALQKPSGRPGSWNLDYNFDLTAEKDWSFELFDLPEGDSFRLAGSKSGHSSTWQEFKRGQKNIELVFGLEGEIAGTVIANAGFPMESLVVGLTLHPEQTEYLSRSNRTSRVQADGSFRMSGLTPGLRELNLSMYQSSGTLLTLPDIQVTAGAESTDSRLQPLDLRDKIWAHELTLVAPNSSEKIRGQLSYDASGSDELELRIWNVSSVITILSATPQIDFELICDGFRPERREGFSGEEAIELRNGLSVKLVLTGDGEIPEPPVFLSVVLQRPPGGSARFGSKLQSFGKTRELQTIAPESGKLIVGWMVSKQMGQGGLGMSELSDPPQYVEVLDADGEQVFEIELTAEECKRVTDKINGTGGL
jgi:hypothetical protein